MANQLLCDGQQFNTVFTNGSFQGPVGGVDGFISIPETPQGKWIHGVSCRWSWNGAPPATNPLQWVIRMAVFAGTLDPTSVLGFSAFGAGNTVKAFRSLTSVPGVKRVLLDVLVPVIQPYSHRWTRPEYIEENTPISMVCSRPIDDTGSQAASNVALTYMALYGDNNSDVKPFNVNLR